MFTGRNCLLKRVPFAVSAVFFPTLVLAMNCPQFPDCPSIGDATLAGDADADGTITYADVRTAEQAMSAPYLLTCSQAAVLDINLNGAMDREDVNALAQVASSGGDPSQLPNFKQAWGDINRDSFVDIRDVSALMRLLGKGNKPGQFDLVVDLNVDQVFDAKDVIELRQCVQGRIDRMGVIPK